jgi:hypothetical protein
MRNMGGPCLLLCSDGLGSPMPRVNIYPLRRVVACDLNPCYVAKGQGLSRATLWRAPWIGQII